MTSQVPSPCLLLACLWNAVSPEQVFRSRALPPLRQRASEASQHAAAADDDDPRTVVSQERSAKMRAQGLVQQPLAGPRLSAQEPGG